MKLRSCSISLLGLGSMIRVLTRSVASSSSIDSSIDCTIKCRDRLWIWLKRTIKYVL